MSVATTYGALRGTQFVWLQCPPWNGLWTRQNHFARRFAADGAEVLYVENPVSVRQRLATTRDVTLLTGRLLYNVEPRLHVMQPPLQFPGSRLYSLAGKLNAGVIAHQVGAWLARKGWKRPLYWCRLPLAVETLTRIRAQHVIYDVVDDYAGFARTARERHLTRTREATLARLADQIFTTTTSLAERLRCVNPHVDVVPNGVDPSFFDAASAPPDPLSHLPRPRIGYVGLVSPWTDFDVLRALGARWPGHVIVVGPVSAEVRSEYEAIPGLVRLPPVHNLEVPKYLRNFDVCIVPHQMIERVHRADPLKIVEYLASGRPVVSSALRGVAPVAHLVTCASGPEEFVAAVADVLENAEQEHMGYERIAYARTRTWDVLYQRVLATLRERDLLT